jgi:hypothetical protein
VISLGSLRVIARLLLLPGLLLAGAGVEARADAGWLSSGDARLRMDLQLLNDAGVIRVPLNQWPLPRETVRYALENVRDQTGMSTSAAMALERVRERMGDHAHDRGAPPSGPDFSIDASGGRQPLWRDFDTPAREHAELAAGAGYEGERFSTGIVLRGVADPDDGQHARLDGSQLTAKLGNWLVSANVLDRWWGPAHDGSLILSSNARPMPTLMVERAAARPFESKLLHWLGPWRFSLGVSQMEDDREDIDSPLFMAWRVEIMPLNDLEIGFSRTAQFCGEQLECNLRVFGNLLAGNDNVGIDATEENEPGNQMAGFDMRWNSPVGALPYAVYGQYIGEDESSYLPAKYLGQMGFEVWHSYADGGMLQLFGEYANTTCSGLSSRGPYYNCAYRQGRFNVEGYRYRGRVIGHSTDADSESYALGAIYAAADGAILTVTGRTARLNHDAVDPNNSASVVPARYHALEFGWRGSLFGQAVSLELGAESIEHEGGDRDIQAFGFLGWRLEFQP